MTSFSFTSNQLLQISDALDREFQITIRQFERDQNGRLPIFNPAEDTPLELDQSKFTGALYGTKTADAVATISAIKSEFLTEEFRGMDLKEFFASQGIN